MRSPQSVQLFPSRCCTWLQSRGLFLTVARTLSSLGTDPNMHPARPMLELLSLHATSNTYSGRIEVCTRRCAIVVQGAIKRNATIARPNRLMIKP